jgi:hypothetical protein
MHSEIASEYRLYAKPGKEAEALLGCNLRQDSIGCASIGEASDFIVVLDGFWFETAVCEVKAVSGYACSPVEAVFVNAAGGMGKAGLGQLNPAVVGCFNPLIAEFGQALLLPIGPQKSSLKE